MDIQSKLIDWFYIYGKNFGLNELNRFAHSNDHEIVKLHRENVKFSMMFLFSWCIANL